MKVAVLSQYYEPEPIRRPVDLARSLAAMGHTVTVVTGFPHYPVGRTYGGYRVRPFTREILNGIPVTRLYEHPYHGKSAVRRILNYASFMVSASAAAPFIEPPDVLYVRHPPLSIGLAAVAMSAVWRRPFVYDVQDIWPESAILSGLMTDGPLAALMRRIERFVYRRAARIIAVTPAAKRNIVGKGAAGDRVMVLPGWADDSAFEMVTPEAASAIRRQLGWADRFVALFAGNLGIVQGLDTIVDAARTLRPAGVVVAFAGDGSEKARLQERVAREGLDDCVAFLGRRDPAEMPAIFAAADALVVHLKACELDEYVVPAKVLSYLAAGRPIVAAIGGAGARLIVESGAGPVVEPESADRLAEAIRRVQEMPATERTSLGEAARSFACERCARHRVIPMYESVLRSAAAG
jgi:glycosyltransferase involved in cell wall biosynthesis